MQDAVMEKNNKVWLITPAQEVLAQGNRGDAALLGTLAYVGVCGEAPSVVLVEEAECISYLRETLFKWKVA